MGMHSAISDLSCYIIIIYKMWQEQEAMGQESLTVPSWLICLSLCQLGFPGGSDGKASTYNAGDLGSIPGLGSSPGEGNGNPLQYSCLENPMDGGAWATVHGVAMSWTRLVTSLWQPTPVFCLEKSMGRGAWLATVHRMSSQSRLSD